MRPENAPTPPNDTPADDAVKTDVKTDETSNVTAEQAKPLDQFNDTPASTRTTPSVFGSATKSKKPLIIGIVAVVALLIGGYAAYALWWNAPNKVIDDALASVMTTKSGTAKGTVDITGAGSPSMRISFDTKGVDKKSLATLGFEMKNEGQTYNVNGSFASDGSTYYVKLADLKKTLDSLYGDTGMLEVFDPLLSKIDNKWVVITPDDIKRLTGEEAISDKETTCVQNVLSGIQSNKNQQKELSDAYQKNRFIVVKESKGTESIDGRQSNHYVLSFDEAKGKAFGEALKKTSVFKAVDDCVAEDLTKSTDEAEDKADKGNTPTVELWVDTWSHKPTKLKITSSDKDDTKMTLETTFNLGASVSVDMPKADTTVKDIEAEINKLQEQFMSTYDTSMYETDPYPIDEL